MIYTKRERLLANLKLRSVVIGQNTVTLFYANSQSFIRIKREAKVRQQKSIKNLDLVIGLSSIRFSLIFPLVGR